MTTGYRIPEYAARKERERLAREAAAAKAREEAAARARAEAKARAEAEKARAALAAAELKAVREAAAKAREATAAKARREAEARAKAEKAAKAAAEARRKAEARAEKARIAQKALELAAVRAAAEAAREKRTKEKARAEAIAVAKREAAVKAEKARAEAERAEAKAVKEAAAKAREAVATRARETAAKEARKAQEAEAKKAAEAARRKAETDRKAAEAAAKAREEAVAVKEAAAKARAEADRKAREKAEIRAKAEADAKAAAEARAEAKEKAEKARRDQEAAERAAVKAAAAAAREKRAREKAVAEAQAEAKRVVAEKAKKVRIAAEAMAAAAIKEETKRTKEATGAATEEEAAKKVAEEAAAEVVKIEKEPLPPVVIPPPPPPEAPEYVKEKYKELVARLPAPPEVPPPFEPKPMPRLSEKEYKAYQALSDEEQFNQQIAWGVIPKGSIYISEKEYIAAPAVEEMKETSPALYAALQESPETYLVAIEERETEHKEWQAKVKSGDIVLLYGVTYMTKGNLEKIKEETPELFKILVDPNRGYKSYLVAVEKKNAEYEEFQVALDKVKDFMTPEGEYNVIGAVEAGVSDKYLNLLFGESAINQAKLQLKTLATLKDYKVVPEISEELIYEELKRGIPIAETKAKLEAMAGYNILKFLIDNPTKKAEQALLDAGFAKEDIRQVLLPPEIIAKPKDTRKFSEKVLDRVALTTIGLWQALTPWKEEKDEGFIDWVKGTPKRLISPDIPSQEELKATYKSEQASPLWARLLFSDTVVYDKKNDRYMPVFLAVVPEKKAAAVKVAGKIVKTISPRESGMSEQQFARFLKFRVNELVKTSKPQINWNNIVKDIYLGKIKSASDAVHAAAAQARWFPKRPPTVSSAEYQAMMKAWTLQGLKDAAAAASNARQYFAVAGTRIVLVPSTGAPIGWNPFKPSELTTAKMKELTAQWLAMKPSAAIKQINDANLVTWAIAYDPVAISKILAKVPPAQLHQTISRLQPAILKAIKADNLTKAQQLAKIQLEVAHQKAIATAKAQEAATKAATEAMTEALAEGATLAEAETAAQTAAETAVQTLTEAITETDTAAKAATEAKAKALAEGATLAEAKTAALTAAETATQTEAATQTAVQEATQAITQTATQTVTETLLETATETATPTTTTTTKPITIEPTVIRPTTIEPTKVKPFGFKLIPPPPEVREVIKRRKEIELGSIAWRQGMYWKYIPPPWDVDKPITLKRGVIPSGAVNTELLTPQETIQMIGTTTAIVPESMSIDLGVVDAFITKRGTQIEFKGKGELTDVGKRLPSPTKGMSVDGAYPGVPVYKEGVRRSLVKRKKKPSRKGKRLTHYEYMTTLKGFRP